MEGNASKFLYVDFGSKQVLGTEQAFKKRRFRGVREEIKKTHEVMRIAEADIEKDYRDKFDFYVRRRQTIEDIARAQADAKTHYNKTVRDKSAGIL